MRKINTTKKYLSAFRKSLSKVDKIRLDRIVGNTKVNKILALKKQQKLYEDRY